MSDHDPQTAPRIPETGSGYESYAENLGLTPEELTHLLAHKSVLVLGAGKNKLTGDIYLRSLDPTYPRPAQIVALDQRYADPKHDEQIKPPLYSLAPITEGKTVRLSSTDPTITAVKQAADNTRVAGDWNNLDNALGDRKFEVILGNYAMNFWSDLGLKVSYGPSMTNAPGRQLNVPQVSLNFPKHTQDAFKQVIDHLDEGGTFIGNSSILYDEWEPHPDLEAELADFFSQQGCSLTIRTGSEQAAHNYRYVVLQITKNPSIT